jgi:copper chaperone CopZ
MKKIRIFIAFICVFVTASVASAQNSKLDGPFLTKRVIKVYGCDLCKTRIEKAARQAPGVTYANWDVDTQQLLVEYNRCRTNPEKIQQVIAAWGYDTEKFKAGGKDQGRTKSVGLGGRGK